MLVEKHMLFDMLTHLIPFNKSLILRIVVPSRLIAHQEATSSESEKGYVREEV